MTVFEAYIWPHVPSKGLCVTYTRPGSTTTTTGTFPKGFPLSYNGSARLRQQLSWQGRDGVSDNLISQSPSCLTDATIPFPSRSLPPFFPLFSLGPFLPFPTRPSTKDHRRPPLLSHNMAVSRFPRKPPSRRNEKQGFDTYVTVTSWPGEKNLPPQPTNQPLPPNSQEAGKCSQYDKGRESSIRWLWGSAPRDKQQMSPGASVRQRAWLLLLYTRRGATINIFSIDKP